MSDKWQEKIAQLSLDLLEVRAARAEAIQRMKEARALTCHSRNESRDQLRIRDEQICRLQNRCETVVAELDRSRAYIDELNSQNCDYQAALMVRSDAELDLKETIRRKDSELQMKADYIQHQLASMQEAIAKLEEENRHLRASLISDQHSTSRYRNERETAQAQFLALQNELGDLKNENAVLKVNWKNGRVRLLTLEDEEITTVIKERDRLKNRLEKMQAFIQENRINQTGY